MLKHRLLHTSFKCWVRASQEATFNRLTEQKAIFKWLEQEVRARGEQLQVANNRITALESQVIVETKKRDFEMEREREVQVGKQRELESRIKMMNAVFERCQNSALFLHPTVRNNSCIAQREDASPIPATQVPDLD